MMANSLGYDLWWLEDLDPMMREVGGNLVLAQWALRCITTPVGQLLDDPGFGYDVAQWLNADIELGPPQVAQINSGVTKALLRDQRVLACNVSTVYLQAQQMLILTIQLTASGGPFTLTVGVDAVSVQLLQPVTG
jgi:hypothetical protein